MASSGGRRRLGRVDPFVLFMVLPLVLIGGVVAWGGLPWVGVLVVVCAGIVVLVDAWSNRPLPFDLPDDYDYEPPPRRR
ncbi:hypothetical protein [Saccharothrix hoggarensis]|uniref:Uncharacterized protein n=1 Tax=Saccharothrix hoggarensis TaxID=913853 RepID=A0ABW3QXG1_9PSEU